MNAFYEQARILAGLAWEFTIERDFSEVRTPLFVARNPALPGCMAQGLSEAEAYLCLESVRIDWIAHLLEHDIPLPELPQSVTTGMGASQTYTINLV